MKISSIINFSFETMQYLVFLFPVLYFYNMVIVGVGGHDSVGISLLVVLIYPILISLLIVKLRRSKGNYIIIRIIRFFLIILFMPSLIYLAAILSYLFKEPDFDFMDIIALVISVILFVSILLFLFRVVKWRDAKG